MFGGVYSPKVFPERYAALVATGKEQYGIKSCQIDREWRPLPQRGLVHVIRSPALNREDTAAPFPAGRSISVLPLLLFPPYSLSHCLKNKIGKMKLTIKVDMKSIPG